MQQMSLHFSMDAPRQQVFDMVRSYLTGLGFQIADSDDTRPWGGYFVIDESQAADFIRQFFPHLSVSDFDEFRKLSPKFLLVAPQKRLSWQYHHRRSEIWRVVGGKAGVAVSDTDDETEPEILEEGEVIELEQGQRHRLVGTDEWGIIAEIWRHIRPGNPSDEDDIVRVQDDFGR